MSSIVSVDLNDLLFLLTCVFLSGLNWGVWRLVVGSHLSLGFLAILFGLFIGLIGTRIFGLFSSLWFDFLGLIGLLFLLWFFFLGLLYRLFYRLLSLFLHATCSDLLNLLGELLHDLLFWR